MLTLSVLEAPHTEVLNGHIICFASDEVIFVEQTDLLQVQPYAVVSELAKQMICPTRQARLF